MRSKYVIIFLSLFSSIFGQADDHYYGDYYATFESPACGDIIEVNKTYTIKWRTNVTSTWYVYLFYYPAGVIGDHCDGDEHTYGYQTSNGELIATTLNTGSYDFKIPDYTDKKGHFVIRFVDEDGSGSGTSYLNNMAVTIIDDKTPPTFISGYPKTSDILGTNLKIKIKTDETGIAYYVLLSDGSTAPTSSEVKAGTGSGGTSAITYGNKSLTANTESVETISNLTSSTSYDIYVVTQDANENLQTSPTKVDVSTTDVTAPTISSVSSSSDNGTYGNGDVINIAVTFSEPVYVTGDPELRLETGSNDAAVEVSYGTGTNTLHFMYTVDPSHQSSDLEASSLNLDGGTIKDAAGNAATLTLPTPGATNSLGANKAIVIDGSATVQKGVSTWSTQSALSNKWTAGNLHTVFFIDSNTGYAGGYERNIFKTTDGGSIWLFSNESQTSGYIEDIYFVDANTGWAVGSSGILWKTTDGGSTWSTQTSGTTRDLYGVYFLDANTGFVIGASGTTLKTTDGGSNWTRDDITTVGDLNSIIFVSSNTGYAVGYNNGASNGAIFKTSNGGSSWSSQTSGVGDRLQDVYFIDANTGWAVGSSGVIISTTNGGTNWSSQTSGTTLNLREIQFINSNVGWALTNSTKILKTTDGGTNWSSETISDKQLFSMSFVDENNGWAVGQYGKVVVYSDVTAPTVTSVSSTADNGTYGIGSVIPITVTFDESVTVTGTPQLTLETGDTDVVVDYSSGSGSSILTFNYTVASGHTSGDLDYGSTSALALNSGTIKDAVGITATLTLAAPGAANSLGDNKAIVIDTVKPTVSSVTSTTDDGSYTEGGTVVVTVTFNEAVTVSGTPQLTLETGDTDAVVDYSSGSGTTILTFNYIVASGHGSSDLGYTSTTALSLNSGTINDSGGNAAVLTLPTPGAANSLSANKAILVDGGKPVVSAVSESPGVFRNTSFKWSSEGWNADFIDPFNSNNDFTIQLWVKYIGPEELDGQINISLNNTKLNLGIFRTRTTFWWTNNNDGSEIYGDINYQFGTDKSHLNSSENLAKDKWYHITLQKSTQNHSVKAYLNGTEITSSSWPGQNEHQDLIGLTTTENNILTIRADGRNKSQNGL